MTKQHTATSHNSHPIPNSSTQIVFLYCTYKTFTNHEINSASMTKEPNTVFDSSHVIHNSISKICFCWICTIFILYMLLILLFLLVAKVLQNNITTDRSSIDSHTVNPS